MDLLGFDLSRDLCLDINNYYAYDYRHFDMESHAHENAEIMYVDSGSCEITLRGKHQLLKKGRFVVIPSGTAHRLFVERGTKCRVLNAELTPVYGRTSDEKSTQRESEGFRLNFSRIAPDSEFGKVLGKYPFGAVFADTSGVGDCIKGLHAELSAVAKDFDRDLEVQALILKLLIAVARSSEDANPGPAYVRSALAFAAKEYPNKLTAETVARQVNLHPVYLERQIKLHTGKTLLEHVTGFRIDAAKKLIESTSLPLIDVGMECGFNSRQSFYETFRRAEGISPSEYRRNKRELAVKNYRQAPFIDPDAETEL